jgi:hypothetical protein
MTEAAPRAPSPMGTLYYVAWCETCHAHEDTTKYLTGEQFTAMSQCEDWARKHCGANQDHRVDLFTHCTWPS